MSEAGRIREAVAFLKARGVGTPDLVLVLGSGLAGFGERLGAPITIPLGDVPGWPAPGVEGHGASLVVGRLGSAAVACLTGRVHVYEGWRPAEVVRAVRTLRLMGARRFLLTNAAGGVNPAFAPGDLMALTDHLNLTGASPLSGPYEAELGPRFPDQSAVYHPLLREVLRRAEPGLREGVYAGLTGPSYETPAEVEMLARLGADAVGMSTVLEAMALNAMGAFVAGLSLISNLAAGIGRQPLDHQEVLEAGRRSEARIAALLERAAPLLVAVE